MTGLCERGRTRLGAPRRGLIVVAAAMICLAVLPAGLRATPARPDPATPGSAPPRAVSDPATLCERAARRAARRVGVPLPVLQAISLVETGRRAGGDLRPWPWALNSAGKGRWFASRKAAVAHAKGLARASRDFDAGCFQLNYRWHGQAFPSIDAMFDPERNATYAAAFLKRLFRETGRWDLAAGLYHSRTPQRARAYRARFVRVLAALEEGRGRPVPARTRAPLSRPAARAPRTNAYPLLRKQDGARPAAGSLVGTGAGRGSLLRRPAAALF